VVNVNNAVPDSELSEAPVLTILYQDSYLVAIDKPAGMLVHRSFLDRHETVFVMQTLRNQIGQHVFPVHRLDRPTSGVLLFALSAEVARLLTAQLTEQHWRKFYLAVCRGFVKQAGILDYPLKEQLDKIADKHADQDKNKQEAVTAFWPLAEVELPIAVGKYPVARYSLLALQPFTGRKHQLRRHLSHLRHPIVGDTTHGETKHNRLFAGHFNSHRLLLIAKRLELTHPITGVDLVIEAPLGELKALFARFYWPCDEHWYSNYFDQASVAGLERF
jgi:tRNA pseudouridine65 synthase